MKYSFPKVDLHLHLDGSFRPSTIWELVQKQGVQMPADTLEGYEAWMEKCSRSGSVNEYLKMFDAPLQVMQDQESLARITKELIEDIAKQGVVYAEIRFAPQLHTLKGLSQSQAIEAVLEGRRQGLEENPSIKIGIICCMMCVGTEDLNWDANMETATITHKYLDKGVVCMDLAGAEGFVPLSNFAPLFKTAKDLGTPLICHAGDSQDWRTVKDAGKVHIEDMKLHLRCPAQPVLHVGLPEDLLDLVEQGALGLFRLANAVAVNRLIEIEADLVSPVLLQLRVG